MYRIYHTYELHYCTDKELSALFCQKAQELLAVHPGSQEERAVYLSLENIKKVQAIRKGAPHLIRPPGF